MGRPGGTAAAASYLGCLLLCSGGASPHHHLAAAIQTREFHRSLEPGLAAAEAPRAPTVELSHSGINLGLATEMLEVIRKALHIAGSQVVDDDGLRTLVDALQWHMFQGHLPTQNTASAAAMVQAAALPPEAMQFMKERVKARASGDSASSSEPLIATLLPVAVGLLPPPSKPTRLFFLHIPKNAGTAIELAGLDVSVRWGDAYKWRFLPMPGGDFCNWAHIPPSDFEQLGMSENPYASSEVFCITRHPYQRLVSAYKFFGTVPWGRLPISGSNFSASSFCSPEALNEWLMQALQEFRSGRSYTRSCFMLPQSRFIWGPPGQQDRQWCKNILRADDLPHAFDRLTKKHGLRMKLQRRNEHGDVCSGLTVASLDSQTRALVDDIYAEDFTRLGYTAGAE